MKKLMALAALLLVHSAAFGQNTNRVYTQPSIPSREALDRLNLKLAWRTYLPTDRRRDGIYSVQLADDQVLVQTRSGMITALSAADGSTLWRANFDVAYHVNNLLGFNAKLVLATRMATLYALDRRTGQMVWSLPLPGGPSAAPAADDEYVYVPLSTGHMYTYVLPQPMRKEAAVMTDKARKESKEEEAMRLADETARAKLKTDLEKELRENAYSPLGVRGQQFTSISKDYAVSSHNDRFGIGEQPRFLWEYHAMTRLEQTPLLTDEHVVIPGQDGTFTLTAKTHLDGRPTMFNAGAALAAPLGHYAILGDDDHIVELAYVASTGNDLFAVDTTKGRIDWRFTAAAPIRSRPLVTDDDIYVHAGSAGLYRIDRKTGQSLWRNMQARRFLAMNKKFVYAVDANGNLLVLDRARGILRGSYDVHEFIATVPNEATDRVYLASNDGLLICLHDRDYPTPLRNKNLPVKKAPEAKPAEDKKPAEAKPEGQPAEKPKAKPEEKPAVEKKEAK
jgi:outer membrane protein assembly factor BamB